jgi:hypothetical protein
MTTRDYPGAVAWETAKAKFGRPTRPRFSTVSVNTSRTSIAANNPRRVALAISNQGSGTVYLSTEYDISLGGGVALNGVGSSLTLSVDEDGESVAWEWFAITADANQSVVVYEVIAL